MVALPRRKWRCLTDDHAARPLSLSLGPVAPGTVCRRTAAPAIITHISAQWVNICSWHVRGNSGPPGRRGEIMPGDSGEGSVEYLQLTFPTGAKFIDIGVGWDNYKSAHGDNNDRAR
ncbi:hypothetical protein GCM10019071_16870 [Sphingobium fuliginis]|uniref:Uncharacterized protein n=1 Tax=Sphingobium fuliginis (strain ATCC 27551) TaxID=336203 RepID=A0ABQ1EUH2_SPHSA|nr:hypothetical protein GCM10019071_16870 [Sphingobium fuliginis]